MNEKGLYKSAFQRKIEALQAESNKLLENAPKEMKKTLDRAETKN